MRRSGIIAAAALAVFSALLLSGWGGPSVLQLVSNLGSLLFGGAALGCTAAAARSSSGPQRRAWAALATGLAGWVAGDVVWAWYELVLRETEAPFPSVADAGYLLFPVAACVALVTFPVGYTRQSRLRLCLDGILVAGSLFVLAWALGLGEVFSTSVESVSTFVVSLAYPLSDLVLLTTALLVLASAQPAHRASIGLLTAGLVCMGVSDSTFVYLIAEQDYVSGHPIDIGYAAGLTLMALAALRRVPNHQGKVVASLSAAALWFPYLLLPVAIGVGLVASVEEANDLPTFVALAIVIAAVLVRQFLVLADNRRLLETMAAQALHDPLTGLANRTLLCERLSAAMTADRAGDRSLAVLCIDLDDFKLVNDSLGHAAGDVLLVQAGARIRGCVRGTDTVARLGGDEFAVLLEDASEPSIDVAHRIRRAFDAPFVLEGQPWVVLPSVGVATTAHAATADLILRNADLAMYAAKRDRGAGVAPYSPDMALIERDETDFARLRGNAGPASSPALFDELRRALEAGDLGVVYQPKFACPSGEVVGVETLVRWSHPRLGPLPPEVFLAVARTNGLMGALTEFVVTRAAVDAARWRNCGRELGIAVNLFAPKLTDPDFSKRVLAILHAHEIPFSWLTIETTGEIVLEHRAKAVAVLRSWREHDVRIAIDGFGDRHSALSSLPHLEVDELKLDHTLIAAMSSNAGAQTVVTSAIDLAHALGMCCVAKGVEDAITARLLSDLGCDVIQGNHCSAPVPAAEVLDVAPLDLTAKPVSRDS